VGSAERARRRSAAHLEGRWTRDKSPAAASSERAAERDRGECAAAHIPASRLPERAPAQPDVPPDLRERAGRHCRGGRSDNRPQRRRTCRDRIQRPGAPALPRHQAFRAHGGRGAGGAGTRRAGIRAEPPHARRWHRLDAASPFRPAASAPRPTLPAAAVRRAIRGRLDSEPDGEHRGSSRPRPCPGRSPAAHLRPRFILE
jgi:hypothetical protein